MLDYIQPKNCTEFYKQQIDENDSFYVKYFSDDGSDKLCPDMTLIDLDFGVLTLEIISCEDAVKIDNEKHWDSYAGETECAPIS